MLTNGRKPKTIRHSCVDDSPYNTRGLPSRQSFSELVLVWVREAERQIDVEGAVGIEPENLSQRIRTLLDDHEAVPSEPLGMSLPFEGFLLRN